jgi:predicted nuclease of predicted toxin-antitoxin system
VLRLLANENIPRVAVDALREQGHDVAWVAETAKGADDPPIALQAQRERRIILTFDKDFGDLIIRRRVARPSGVILCRFRAQSPDVVVQVLSHVLQRPLPWEDHFAVVEEADIRMVPLP